MTFSDLYNATRDTGAQMPDKVSFMTWASKTYDLMTRIDSGKEPANASSASKGSTLADDIYTELTGVRVPILMYHHISNQVLNGGIVTPEKFEDDIKSLLEEGYTPIFISDLSDYLNGYNTLPDKPIIITFDDGYESNYEYAYPVAKALGVKITISPIGWSVGRSTFLNSDLAITPHFTWEEAKEMYDSGLVDFQNHTYDLHSPEGLSYGQENSVSKGVLALEGENFEAYKTRLTSDLMRLQYDMFQETGHISTILCYPYGAYSEDSERILKSIGYIGSLTTREGVRTYYTPSDLWAMPRLNVTNALRGQALIEKIEAAYEN